jgi:hypothetical protein
MSISETAGRGCFLLCLLLAAAFAGGCSDPHPAESAPPPPLYVSLVIHAEENYMLDEFGVAVNDPNRLDFLAEAQFRHTAKAMRDLARVFQRHGAKINFQPDWTFVEGVTLWDPSFFVEFEAMGHQVDAHAHELLVSYPDLWLMIKNADGNPSPVVGGYLLDDAGGWSDRFNGLYDTFKILWGGGTIEHFADPYTKGYVYRPSAANWLDHDPEQKLVSIAIGNRIPDSETMDDAGRNSLDYALTLVNAEAVNTFTFFEVADSFLADAGAPDIPVNFTAAYGQPTNWLTRIEEWDRWLSVTADPYVQAGKMEWKSLTEMNDLFNALEQQKPGWWVEAKRIDLSRQ